MSQFHFHFYFILIFWNHITSIHIPIAWSLLKILQLFHSATFHIKSENDGENEETSQKFFHSINQ